MSKETDEQTVVSNRELVALAEAQAVRVGNMDELLSKGPLGPADETADMLIDAIYGWRNDDIHGSPR